MAFRELVSPSLTELFVKELEGMILSGELQVGERLPAERDMAQQMRVSLAVVNSGVKRLQDKGFLRVVPRRGVYVADYIREGNMQTLEAMLEYSEQYFQADLFDAIVECRRSCELPSIELACRNGTEADLRSLRAILADFDRAQGLHEKSEHAFRFHHEVTLMSKNMVYPLIVATFKRIYSSSYYAMFTLRGPEQSRRQLGVLYDCVATHDAELARARALEFIDQWQAVFRARYREGQPYSEG